MKKVVNQKLKLSIVILITGILTNCSQEEGNPVDYSNYFKYEKKKYALHFGWIRNEENLTGGIDHTTICLYSEGLEWNQTNEEFSGKGNLVYIRFRREGSELENGIYNYQASTEGPYLLTLSTISFSFNWDMNNNTGTYGYCREGSVVDILRDGDIYTINFNLVPTLSLGNVKSDTPVTGTYSGTLTTLF